MMYASIFDKINTNASLRFCWFSSANCTCRFIYFSFFAAVFLHHIVKSIEGVIGAGDWRVRALHPTQCLLHCSIDLRIPNAAKYVWLSMDWFDLVLRSKIKMTSKMISKMSTDKFLCILYSNRGFDCVRGLFA